MEQVVSARGHEHVAATHESTVEVTSDDYLTPAGDCILGISADRVPADFPAEFVDACRDPDARIVATLAADGHRQRIRGSGHPDLSFASRRGLVCRTSTHVDDRTVMVGADAAAADVDRGLVSALAAGAPLDLCLRVESPTPDGG